MIPVVFLFCEIVFKQSFSQSVFAWPRINVQFPFLKPTIFVYAQQTLTKSLLNWNCLPLLFKSILELHLLILIVKFQLKYQLKRTNHKNYIAGNGCWFGNSIITRTDWRNFRFITSSWNWWRQSTTLSGICWIAWDCSVIV